MMNESELTDFMNDYWKAAELCDFSTVEDFIDHDATFFFSEGPFVGIQEIKGAFEATWDAIKDEEYSAKDLRWILVTGHEAVCTYKFTSEGVINGERKSLTGLGTNVVVMSGEDLKILHEHLSVISGS